MQTKSERFGAVAGSLHQRELLRKGTTYLAKIAVVLQDAPAQMLTFTQLMDRLAPFIHEGRKSLENNIRVCLSTNKCFVKIPLVSDSLSSKRNYWKLDFSQITAKMVRRHFKGILELFPELTFKVEAESASRVPRSCSALLSPDPAARKGIQSCCEGKFSGPFSIESLLKRDGPPTRASKALPLVAVRGPQQQAPLLSLHTPAGTKRNFSWRAEALLMHVSSRGSPVLPAGGSPAHHRLLAERTAAKPSNRMLVGTGGPSFPIYARVSTPPYYGSSPCGYTPYSAPTFAPNALCFRM